MAYNRTKNINTCIVRYKKQTKTETSRQRDVKNGNATSLADSSPRFPSPAGITKYRGTPPLGKDDHKSVQSHCQPRDGIK